MENENDNLDDLSELDENDNSLNENDDLSALQKAKEELSGKNRKLFERAKKSETEVKELRKKIEEYDKKSSEEKPAPQSNEPDYGKLAFLNSKGIDHADDIKIAVEEAERLKLPLTDVLQMEHIQTRLKVNKETREAQMGMPKGGGRAGEGNTPHDINYWLSKGGLPDNQELAEKVVDARMNKESQNKFSDEMYIG